jgi:hypothetical protein
VTGGFLLNGSSSSSGGSRSNKANTTSDGVHPSIAPNQIACKVVMTAPLRILRAPKGNNHPLKPLTGTLFRKADLLRADWAHGSYANCCLFPACGDADAVFAESLAHPRRFDWARRKVVRTASRVGPFLFLARRLIVAAASAFLTRSRRSSSSRYSVSTEESNLVSTSGFVR